ncbi:hypothetical protein K504DRAFT_468390 [Pleomassaria siparia CBS 279.74]|uniref:Uncharacterized protein n=1 Tax=Pleomassaria siparia CBS 279.74 TaxID=1314801 RepID=A0A6G1K5B6_9PLEO|nr:hypothetical protein K504DRAFT_468390 [Pleomassaria siparia CBS 279.74]
MAWNNDNYDKDVEKVGMGMTAGHYADDGAVAGETFVQGDGMYAKLQRLAGRFNVEQRGIERVPEDERDDTSLLNVGTMVHTLFQPTHQPSKI